MFCLFGRGCISLSKAGADFEDYRQGTVAKYRRATYGSVLYGPNLACTAAGRYRGGCDGIAGVVGRPTYLSTPKRTVGLVKI